MNFQSREEKFAKNTVILGFGTFLPKLAEVITLPIYTAYLTKAEYGTYDLISILYSLLLPVATLQIQSAAFRFLLDKKGDKEQIQKVITALYSFVVAISAVVLFLFFIIMPQLEVKIRILLVTYYFIDILLSVTRQVARGLSMNHKYSISAIINSFLNMILVVIFLLGLKTGLTGLILCLTLSVSVSFVYLFYSLKIWIYINPKSFDKTLLGEMIQYAWPMVPNNISFWIIKLSDRFLISIFLGVEANAIYVVANKIPSLLQLAQNTFSMAWSESASLTVNDADSDTYYSKMFQIIQRILGGFAAVLMAMLPILFKILIRGNYEAAYVQIPPLIIAMYYSSIAIYLGGLYIANKRTKNMGMTTIVAAVINFLINLLFIKKIGIFAATLSTMISYFVQMVYRMMNVKTFQNIKYNYKEIVIVNVTLFVMMFVCFQDGLIFYLINFLIGGITCIVLNKSLLFQIINKLKSKS